MDSGPGTSLPPRQSSTYLLHLPGIGGTLPLDRQWVNALVEGGVADHTEVYDWTGDNPGVFALEAHQHNRLEAAHVARLICQRAASYPHEQIVLTAESGGTGVAIWALEFLPPAVQVDEVLLVAPAISPDYDLSAALRHVRGKLYYLSSPGDWLTLGMCTSVFGTMDGQNTQSAGYVGFRQPPAAQSSEYRKLVELRYRPGWSKWGDFGNHTGGLSPEFARNVLAPLLVVAEDDTPPVSATYQPEERRVKSEE
jgi:hypothetical protein